MTWFHSCCCCCCVAVLCFGKCKSSLRPESFSGGPLRALCRAAPCKHAAHAALGKSTHLLPACLPADTWHEKSISQAVPHHIPGMQTAKHHTAAERSTRTLLHAAFYAPPRRALWLINHSSNNPSQHSMRAHAPLRAALPRAQKHAARHGRRHGVGWREDGGMGRLRR